MRTGFEYLAILTVTVTILSACGEDNTATHTEAGWLYTEPETLEEFSGTLDINIDDSGHVSAYPKDFRSLRIFMFIDNVVGDTPRVIAWQKLHLAINPEKIQLGYATSLLSIKFQLSNLSVTVAGNWSQVIEPENIKTLRAVFKPGVKATLFYRLQEDVEAKSKDVVLTTREVEVIRTVMDFYEFLTT